MKKYISCVTAFLLLVAFAISVNASTNPGGHATTTVDNQSDHRILIFSKTDGWRHDSIETGRDALIRWAEERGVHVDATEDASEFNTTNLSQYHAVVFLNTTENVFNDNQREAFKSYIQNGGGFAGVHSATDTEYEWPWYNELVGAYFNGHPRVQTATLHVLDQNHPSTEMLPEEFEKRDEWYNFRDFNEDVNVLMSLDPQSFEGSDHPDFHPIAWYHNFDGGRAFYTGLGHTEESYSEEYFMNHLWGGIEYAMGIAE
jgi:uncharacterized protein